MISQQCLQIQQTDSSATDFSEFIITSVIPYIKCIMHCAFYYILYCLFYYKIC